MKKTLTYPPFYFFSIIILNFLFYFLFSEFNMIPFPYNLAGIIAVIFGCHLLNENSKTFKMHKTTFTLDKPSVFVQTGFFKISRNPMYLGALFVILGQSILLGTLISMTGPVFFFLSINYFCIPPEEILMEKTFANKYLAYKQKVRRWL